MTSFPCNPPRISIMTVYVCSPYNGSTVWMCVLGGNENSDGDGDGVDVCVMVMVMMMISVMMMVVVLMVCVCVMVIVMMSVMMMHMCVCVCTRGVCVMIAQKKQGKNCKCHGDSYHI